MVSTKFNQLLIVLMIVGSAYGLYHLFILRFEVGDVFPDYSSLRSDPMGTRALYESLENLKKINVQRHYRPVSKLEPGEKMVLLFLGIANVNRFASNENDIKDLEKIAEKGARVIFSFYPTKGKTRGSNTNDKKSNIRSIPYMESRWGTKLAFEKKDDHQTPAQKVSDKGQLPESIPWHSSLYFESVSSDWKTVYERNGHPVMLERRFGRGSIILSGDSYFFSNEALFKDRHSALFAWLIGKNTSIIFDEYHLGINQNPGVMTLARKYRLHGVFIALVVIAGLFVWKNAVVFVPPTQDETQTDAAHTFVSRRDHRQALIGLLRRNVQEKQILSVCMAEWEKSYTKHIPKRDHRMDVVIRRMKDALEKGIKRDTPVETYRAVSQILHQKDWKHRNE